MANHKSAEKRARQIEKKRMANRSRRSEVRTQVKKLRQAISSGDKETAQSLIPRIQSLFGKLVKSGILKAPNASRKVGRLAQQASALK